MSEIKDYSLESVNISKIKDYLTRHGYKYEHQGNMYLFVNLGHHQQAIIEVENEKVVITDKLLAWNSLTTFPSKLKNALWIAPILYMVLMFLFYLDKDPHEFFGTFFPLTIAIIIIAHFIYYIVRYESFKTRIELFVSM